MPNFTNQTPASTYPDILTIGTLNQVGLTNVLTQVQDAYGTGTNLSLSTLGFNIARSGYFFSLDSVNITAQGVDINSMCAPNPVALGTASLTLPVGPTANRPGTPTVGMMRYNSDTNEFEGYEAGSWLPFATGSVGTVTSVGAVVSGFGMSITGSPITTSGTFTFTLSPELQGLSVINGTGIVARTTIGGYATRTITGTTNEITVIDGDGVNANPTLSIPATFIAPGTIAAVTSVSAPEYLVTGSSSGTISILPQANAGTFNFNLPITAGPLGYLLTSGGGGATAMTWTDPTTIGGVTSVHGTVNQIDVSSTTGSVTFSLDSALILPGTLTTSHTVTLSGLTASTFLGLDASKNIVSIVQPLVETLGGTAQSTYTTGDTLYASAANTLSKLAGNITAVKQYLSQTGTGVASAAPIWATISGGDITGAALTVGNDTNVTLTLGGTPATSLLRAASVTAGWTGQLSLTRGGSNADLSAQASNGGIVWSNATQMQILAGTATANQVLLSGSTATPAWSTATYPATTTINDLLYSTSNNVIGQLTTTNSASLSTNATGVPTWLALTDGQIVVGSSAGAPLAANITGTGGITVTNGHNSIQISGTGSAGWSIVNQNTNTVTMTAGSLYLINNGASLVTLTLPSSPVAGDSYRIVGASAGGWSVVYNLNQLIELPGGTATTTSTGSISSNNQWDTITIRFTETANTFTVDAVTGAPIYV